MCRAQCVLALVAMYVGLAHSSSWDFAVASGANLQFYFKENKTFSEKLDAGDIQKIAYDPIGNRMFYFDADNKDTFLFSYDMTTKRTEPLVSVTDEDERIEGIAFDPVEQILFWNVHYYSTIYWLSLKPGAQNNINGNFLITTSGWGTSTITIDSCRGYIYWTNIDEGRHKFPSLIERARFDGSKREAVIRTGLQMPKRLVFDPQTQKLYWTDGTQETDKLPTAKKQFSIESADLNGKNRTVLYYETGVDQPKSLSISEDFIYWSHSNQKSAWQLPKNVSIETKPKEIHINGWDEIVTNYKIQQQIQRVQDCDRLKSFLQNDSLSSKNNSINVATDKDLNRVPGSKVGEESQHTCKPGEIGERFNGSVCQNYCFKGGCSVSAEGQPRCRCDAGYSGERCEINLCQGYCLNAGVCSVDKENAPICQCQPDYEGERCEVSTCLNKCFQRIVSVAWNVIKSEVTPSTQTQDGEVKTTCAASNF